MYKYANHPGGQAHLDNANAMTSQEAKELSFLSYHVGLDHAKIKARTNAFPKTGPLYDVVHECVAQVKRDHPYQVYVYKGYCLALTVAFITAYVYWLYALNKRATLSLAACLISYGFNIFHGRHHQGPENFYGLAWLDALTYHLYNVLDNTLAPAIPNWVEQHHNQHHLYPNDHEKDYDVKSPFPALRVHRTQRVLWYHAYQHVYLPAAFALNGFLLCLLRKPLYYSALFLGLFFGAPAFVHGVLAAVTYGSLLVSITGVAVSYLFQVSHNHKEIGMSKPVFRPHNEPAIDHFVRSNITQSCSWGGYLSGLVFGGINYQIEHHVAPALPMTLYHYMAPQLRRICKQRGILYVREESFFDAIASYHSYMRAMGTARDLPAADLLKKSM